MKIRVGNITISHNSKPFIIAEMSGNHGQSLKKHLRLLMLQKNQVPMRLNFKLIRQTQ